MIPDNRAAAPAENIIREVDRGNVRRALDGIADRAEAVVRQRYGIDGEQVRTREQIGGRLGVTAERVRQIEQRALRRMRMMLSEDG